MQLLNFYMPLTDFIPDIYKAIKTCLTSKPLKANYLISDFVSSLEKHKWNGCNGSRGRYRSLLIYVYKSFQQHYYQFQYIVVVPHPASSKFNWRTRSSRGIADTATLAAGRTPPSRTCSSTHSTEKHFYSLARRHNCFSPSNHKIPTKKDPSIMIFPEKPFSIESQSYLLSYCL